MMKKYPFIRRNVRLNVVSGVLIGTFGVGISILIILRAANVQSMVLGLLVSSFIVYVAISGIWQWTRGYTIEDDGKAIHKVSRNGKRETLLWNEIGDVRVRRARNQLVLTNYEGNRRILIDTQLRNFGELFA